MPDPAYVSLRPLPPSPDPPQRWRDSGVAGQCAGAAAYVCVLPFPASCAWLPHQPGVPQKGAPPCRVHLREPVYPAAPWLRVSAATTRYREGGCYGTA